MIETRQLSKRYGRITAVDAISFTVGPGEVLGFLGPNGAGKSTTMRMLAGFVAPSSGSASVCGHDVVADPLGARRALGYLPEGAPSYGEMRVRVFLSFVADAHRLEPVVRRNRLDEVVARLALGTVLAQRIDTLSKGFRRRVALAAAILHNPPALLLDEPTDGLDPNQKHDVRQLIREMSRDRTIVISTHILEEVQALCTRAIVIANGRLLADATPAEFEQRSRYHGAVSLRVGDSVTARSALEGMQGVKAVEVDDASDRLVVFPSSGVDLLSAIGERLRMRGLAFSDARIERGRLDDVFRSLTVEGAVR
ncbi:MAG TPA: ABC transporter ATP-binding protein [Xanthomonadaceae bacterium]|jgi:ABC-2 type transport system ATP-binding protein|nr:ABC transporter ATP-binding protein [Xanthomonadaceae bacterium]